MRATFGVPFLPRQETCRVRFLVMTYEVPRDPAGDPLCVWCGGEIKQSGIGRRKEYCSRTHREYAYRARREAQMKLRAYSKGRADERGVSSTDARQTSPVPSVDEKKAAGPAPVPARPAPTRPEPVPGSMPPGPSKQKRRRLLPPPPGVRRAEAPTLFEPDSTDSVQPDE